MAQDGSTHLSYKIIGHLGKLLARNQTASKTEMRELDKDLGLLTQQDADALVEAGTLELLLRYLTVDQHFDVVTKCLIALSTFESARTGIYDMNETGIVWLSDHAVQQAKNAKGEKQLEKATVLAKILILYCVDIPHPHLTWWTDLSKSLTTSLERASTKIGMTETYNYLSILLPSFWVCTGTNLAPNLAQRLINAGAMPLLLKVARDVQRADLKGLPKINAEKALNLLLACNAEQPVSSLHQVTAVELAQYCFETVIKSDWVQSQELSVLLLARMVFHHHSLPREYLDREEVVHMLSHAMKCKSPALRMTAFCLASICSERVFETVCIEANQAIMDLASGSFASVKRLASPTAAGMQILKWGAPLNKFAKDLLRSAQLLTRIAEVAPANLPTQLLELLPPDLKQYVVGIKAAQGLEDVGTGGEDEENENELGAETGSEPAAIPVPDFAGPSGTRKPLVSANIPPMSAVHKDTTRTAGANAAPVTKDRRPAAGAAALNGHTGVDAKGRTITSASQLAAVAPQAALLPEQPTVNQQPLPTTAQPAGIAVKRPGGDDEGSQSHGDAKRAKLQSNATTISQRGLSAGGTQSGGSVGLSASGFTTADYTQVNNFLYDLMMQHSKLDEKAQQVLDNLLKCTAKFPGVITLKRQLPTDEAATADESLKAWAQRLRQMGGNLMETKGPALDMVLNFSNVMLEEITCYQQEMEQKVNGMAS